MNKVSICVFFLFICVFVPSVLNAQTARWVIKPQYNSIIFYGNGMYKVKSGSNVGIIDTEGKLIVPVTADSITSMTENCALVLQSEEGKYRLHGILHSDRRMVSIADEWYVNDYPFFSEGKLPVYNKKGKYGYIGLNGKLILDFVYSSVHPFSEGWAAVCKGKGLLTKGMELIKKNKDKVFYINERGTIMGLQSDIGDIYSGTSFKNGEALVITKDNRYCFINTMGQLLRIDNNVVLMFDEKYALQTTSNSSKKKNGTVITYDGPTTFAENNLYGYKQGGKVLLPSQFKEALPFSKGYAIAAKSNGYGLLKLVQGSFQCRSVAGSLKATDTNTESVDYVVSVPDGWKDALLELSCISADGTKTTCDRSGDASKNRVFSFILAKGKRQLSLEGENLIVWENGMATSSSRSGYAETDKIGISVSPTTVKANVKDNAPISVTLTNNTSETVELTVKVSGERLKAVTKELTLEGGQSGKVYTYFMQVSAEEYRTVTVSTSVSENSVTKRIQVKPFFTEY